MDLSNRRWEFGALLMLPAAVLLTLAAFLPQVKVVEAGGLAGAPMLDFTVYSWGARMFFSGHAWLGDTGNVSSVLVQQLAGAVLVLVGGLVALVAVRKGRRKGLLLPLAAMAFNVGVTVHLAVRLSGYLRMFSGMPEVGKFTGSLMIGSWLLFTGMLVLLAAAVMVVRGRRQPGESPVPVVGVEARHRRVRVSAVLALSAAAVLLLAVFFPRFDSVSPADPGRGTAGSRTTVYSWGYTFVLNGAETSSPFNGFGGLYQQLAGVVLALVAGVVTLIALRRGNGHRTRTSVLPVVATAFNFGAVSVVVAVVDTFRGEPFTKVPNEITFGLGTWGLYAGLLLLVTAVAVVVRRDRGLVPPRAAAAR